MSAKLMTLLELRTAITQAIRSSSDPGAQAGAVLTIVTQQLLATEKSAQAYAPVPEVDALRAAQARDVMPLIGSLLDSFELLANDLKTDPDLRELVRNLQAIEEAMLTAEPNEEPIEQAPAPEDGEVIAWKWNQGGEMFTTSKPDEFNAWKWTPLFTRSNAKAGEVVVTRDESGEIVAVTRQDEEGQILSVIATRLSNQHKVMKRGIADVVSQAKAGEVPGPLTGKYGDVLTPFVAMMERELHANAGKGDRPAWLQMTPAVGMLEIYYHAAKLQKAVKDGNADGVREYAADVANMSMMLVDVCGALSAAHRREVANG